MCRQEQGAGLRPATAAAGDGTSCWLMVRLSPDGSSFPAGLQACEGLPENGVVDEAVWEALVRLTGTPATHPVPGAAPTAAAQQPAAAAAAAEASAGKPSYQALFEQVLQQGAGAGASEQRTEELVVSDEVVITDSVQSVPGGGLVETITITEEIR